MGDKRAVCFHCPGLRFSWRIRLSDLNVGVFGFLLSKENTSLSFNTTILILKMSAVTDHVSSAGIGEEMELNETIMFSDFIQHARLQRRGRSSEAAEGRTLTEMKIPHAGASISRQFWDLSRQTWASWAQRSKKTWGAVHPPHLALSREEEN